MSLLKQVVQAQCPKCKNTLRIPASWIHEPMKCKHCGMVFQAKAPAEKKENLLGRAIRAATTLHQRRKRRKKKKNKDGTPVAMPVRAPMAGGPVVVPTAKPVAGGIQAAPLAILVPPGAAMNGTAPVAMPVGLAHGRKLASRRRSRGAWQKIAFVLIFGLGLGSLGAIVYQTNPGLFSPQEEEQVAAGGPTTTATDTKATKANPLFVTKATKPNTTLFVAKATTRRVTPTYPKTAPKETTRKRPPDTKLYRPDNTETVRPDMTTPSAKPNDTAYKSWPRRMLAISVNNYALLNPVSYGRDKPFDKAAYSLAQALRVPNDQVVFLGDRATQATPPTKPILQDTIARVLASSRTVDHVVLLFAGHGIEVEGVPYLVPQMADKDDAKGLVALDWVYARLAACPAQQKLLVLDIARYDPKRGEEFGKTEPLGAQFATLVQKPPKGVQVLTSCAAGQYSYEIQSDLVKVHGGVFQEAIVELNGKLNGVEQKIDGLIPAEELTEALGRRTSPKVKTYFNVSKLLNAGTKPVKKEDKDAKEEAPALVLQTPQLHGTLFVKTVAFDPKSDPAPKVLVKKEADPVFKDGTASSGDIASLLAEQRKIVTLKQGDNSDFYLHLPFAKKPLAAYLAKDNKDSDLRDFVLKAIEVLNETKASFPDTMQPLPENPQQKAQFIRGIADRQESLALVYSKLDGALEELKSVEKLRKDETPRWKANYDYVVARVHFRMVHFYEYQVMLGKIRKEDLPPLDKNLHKGYKLSQKAALDGGEDVKLANDGKKVLKRLAEDSKGTPWEVIAKREMNTSLGLEWVAY